MRWLVCLLLLVSVAHASEPELDDALDNARWMRVSGIVLAVAGIALAGGAIAAGASTADSCGVVCSDANVASKNLQLVWTATGLGVTSSVLLAVGIPLWAVGDKRVHDLKLKISASGQGGAAGISGNF